MRFDVKCAFVAFTDSTSLTNYTYSRLYAVNMTYRMFYSESLQQNAANRLSTSLCRM